MSYMVTRKEDDKPEGRRHVMIDQKPPDGDDAGFGHGGSFYFMPGETIPMSEYAARIIMTDPALKNSFTVDPPLPAETKPRVDPSLRHRFESDEEMAKRERDAKKAKKAEPIPAAGKAPAPVTTTTKAATSTK